MIAGTSTATSALTVVRRCTIIDGYRGGIYRDIGIERSEEVVTLTFQGLTVS
jgi:hypothetical protein